MGELLEIVKLVTLSTCHLSESTSKNLPNGASANQGVVGLPDWWPEFTRDEGWLFWVPADEVIFEAAFAEAPKDLRDVLMYVRNSGCEWCLFDCDGPICDALYQYEW
jgi:hypothetical protein